MTRNFFKRSVVLAILLMVSAFISAETGSPEVISFIGKVEYKSGTGWKPVAVGELLEQGTVISTGFKSSAVLKIGGSNFTVQPLSRVTISRLVETEGGNETEMNISAGKMKIDVKPVSGKTAAFTVRSPAATASIRGTSGVFSADGFLEAATGVWSYDTRVNMHGILVYAGESVGVSERGELVLPQVRAQKKSSPAGGATRSLSVQEAVSSAPSAGRQVGTTEEGVSSAAATITEIMSPMETATVIVTVSPSSE